MSARQVAKGDVKAVVAHRAPVPVALPPSVEAAELRRAARARQAVVARVMRQFSARR